MKRKVLGYLGTLDEGYGKGSIPKDLIKKIWDCGDYIKANKLPIGLAVIGFISI